MSLLVVPILLASLALWGCGDGDSAFERPPATIDAATVAFMVPAGNELLFVQSGNFGFPASAAPEFGLDAADGAVSLAFGPVVGGADPSFTLTQGGVQSTGTAALGSLVLTVTNLDANGDPIANPLLADDTVLEFDPFEVEVVTMSNGTSGRVQTITGVTVAITAFGTLGAADLPPAVTATDLQLDAIIAQLKIVITLDSNGNLLSATAMVGTGASFDITDDVLEIEYTLPDGTTGAIGEGG
jgi:hypothetical protein